MTRDQMCVAFSSSDIRVPFKRFRKMNIGYGSMIYHVSKILVNSYNG